MNAHQGTANKTIFKYHIQRSYRRDNTAVVSRKPYYTNVQKTSYDCNSDPI